MIPYSSLAQEHFFHSPGAKRAGITKSMVKEWDKATKGRKLPARKNKFKPPTKKEMIREHERLVPILRSGNKKGLRKKALEQGKELKGLKRAKIVINNRLKGSYGAMNPKTNKVEISIKAHKKHGKLDRAELASTVKHELLHVSKPKLTEKQVYKKTAKTKISEGEQNKLIAKLRRKTTHYKVGAYKRKFKLGRRNLQPGELFNQSRSQKAKIAIMGM